MREILFKAKRDTELQEWIYGQYWHDHDSEEHLIYTKDGSHLSIIPETLCQYTGLRDRNGERIFDGDILSYMDGLSFDYVVTIGKLETMYKLIDSVSKKASKCLYSFSHNEPEKLTITGNIHDNKE